MWQIKGIYKNNMAAACRRNVDLCKFASVAVDRVERSRAMIQKLRDLCYTQNEKLALFQKRSQDEQQFKIDTEMVLGSFRTCMAEKNWQCLTLHLQVAQEKRKLTQQRAEHDAAKAKDQKRAAFENEELQRDLQNQIRISDHLQKIVNELLETP